MPPTENTHRTRIIRNTTEGFIKQQKPVEGAGFHQPLFAHGEVDGELSAPKEDIFPREV